MGSCCHITPLITLVTAARQERTLAYRRNAPPFCTGHINWEAPYKVQLPYHRRPSDRQAFVILRE